MGNVILTMKIMPEGVEVDMEEFALSVKAAAGQHSTYLKHEIQPIAFGLNALILYVQIPDAEGGSEKLETAISEVEYVRSIEVTNMTRSLV